MHHIVVVQEDVLDLSSQQVTLGIASLVMISPDVEYLLVFHLDEFAIDLCKKLPGQKQDEYYYISILVHYRLQLSFIKRS